MCRSRKAVGGETSEERLNLKAILKKKIIKNKQNMSCNVIELIIGEFNLFTQKLFF